MEKILLDTDIGTDIDDAVCLAYLLAEPECELLGITTVQGNTYERAKLASAFVYLSGKDIPIFEGTKYSLTGIKAAFEVPQAKALERLQHADSFRTDWIEFMRQTIRKNPHEITLLAIGPMTNIALLFTYDPELPGLLKQLVLMCGAFYGDYQERRYAEWNARLDPYATAIVYRTKCAAHRSIGLDVTMKVALDASETRRKFKGPLLSAALETAGIWFEKREKIIFHDPLAAVSIFHPEIVTFQKGDVSVEVAGKENLGFTRFTPSVDGSVEVADTVRADTFMQKYFSVFE